MPISGKALKKYSKVMQCYLRQTLLQGLLLLPLLLLPSCADLSSTTTRVTTTNPTNGVVTVTEKTTLHAFAVIDSTENLSKIANRSGYATNSAGVFAPGTYATGLNESATSTNVVNAIMVGVMTGLKAAGL